MYTTLDSFDMMQKTQCWLLALMSFFIKLWCATTMQGLPSKCFLISAMIELRDTPGIGWWLGTMNASICTLKRITLSTRKTENKYGQYSHNSAGSTAIFSTIKSFANWLPACILVFSSFMNVIWELPSKNSSTAFTPRLTYACIKPI